jgi:hypothetical protein
LSHKAQRRREPGKVSSVAAKKQDSTPVDVRAVAVEVVRLLLATLTQPSGWSTRKGHEHPDYSRDQWRAIAHAIGTKRGRYHYVSAESLAAYEQNRGDASPIPAPSDWTPADAARELDLRVVEGGKR